MPYGAKSPMKTSPINTSGKHPSNKGVTYPIPVFPNISLCHSTSYAVTACHKGKS
jgi:hypothetical protein